jgi:hypothetical protein
MPREIDIIDPHLGPGTTAGIGWVRGELTIPITLPAGTGAYAAVTAFAPGFKRIVESVAAFVGVAGAGAGASRTLELLKNAVVVATGTLTLANTATPGAAVALAVTDANAEFLDADTLTVDMPAGGTAFTGGAVVVVIKYRTRPQQVS